MIPELDRLAGLLTRLAAMRGCWLVTVQSGESLDMCLYSPSAFMTAIDEWFDLGLRKCTKLLIIILIIQMSCRIYFYFSIILILHSMWFVCCCLCAGSHAVPCWIRVYTSFYIIMYRGAALPVSMQKYTQMRLVLKPSQVSHCPRIGPRCWYRRRLRDTSTKVFITRAGMAFELQTSFVG